jgi:hypothetical protein
MPTSYTSGLNFTAPSQGDTNWASTQDTANAAISAHDHTGGGKGLQIATAAIATNAVTDTKIRLANNAALRARNAAGSADVDLIKVNTSDAAVLPAVTSFGVAAQSPASGATISITSNFLNLSSAIGATLTINVPTAAQAGQPVFVFVSGAGTWDVTITGRPVGSDVATMGQYGSMILFPIGTTTWAAIPGGGCTLA